MAKRKFKSLVEMFSGPGSAKRWIQGTEARNSAGFHVNPRSNDATCWCLRGAIDHCYPPTKRYRITCKLEEAIERDPILMAKIKKTWKRIVGGIVPIDLANDHPETTIRDIRRVVRKAGV